MNLKSFDKKPLVSVIMPVYNAERFVEEAIASVLKQSYENWELIIIDDCSKDSSFIKAENMALKDKRIRFLKNERNMGVAKTRNRGINLSEGEYVAFLDSDDLWHKDKLKNQLEKMEAEAAGICYCSYEIIGASGNKVKADYIVPENASLEDIMKENFIQCSAMLIRKDIVKRFMFNTDFYHEDYILGLDILGAGIKAAGCKEKLLCWRYLENSRSFDKRKSALNRWKIYRDYLKLPLFRSIYLFANYAAAGLKKYHGNSET